MTGPPSSRPLQPELVRLGAGLRAVGRVTRRVLVGAALVLALLGAATVPATVVLVCAPGLGLAAGLLVAVGNPDFPRRAGARRGVWVAGTIGTLLLPFAAGATLAGPAGAVVVVGLLTHGAVWAAEQLTGTDDAVSAARRHLASLERVVPGLPTEALVGEWRSSEQGLDPDVDPCVRAVTAEVRALVVDELTRRDPAGVARWLRAGGGDPEEHLSGGAGCPA